jgi:hypothetical protein
MKQADIRRRGAWVVVAAAALLFAPAGRAEAPAEPVARYQVSARPVILPEVLATHFEHLGPIELALPGSPPTVVPLGEQARYAYVKAVHALFQPATPAGADLEVIVTSVAAKVRVDVEGRRIGVEHEMLVRTLAGEELARWTVVGEARLEGNAPGAVTLAFTRAATAAADHFGFSFEEQPGVAAWLAARGLPPLGSHRPPPPELPLMPGRAASIAFADFGFGMVQASGRVPPGASLRAGVAGRALHLQLSAQRWTFDGRWSGVSEVEATTVGLDASLVARLGAGVAVRGGGSVMALLGRSTYRSETGFDVRGSASRVVTALVAGGEYTFGADRRGSRARIGLEARWLATDELRFGPSAVAHVGGTSLLVLLGWEAPWHWGLFDVAPPGEAPR